VFSLLLIVALLACPVLSFAQTNSNSKEPAPRIHTDQSVVVGAHLTPEEVEDGKINDIYQPIYKFEREENCDGIIETARSAVIPAAEQATFVSVRNKFLFLSYRGIGDCTFKAKHYAEAEETYLKAVEYADKDDSSYAINFESIALCRMAQQQISGAEEPMEKAVSLLGDEIQRLKMSDSYKKEDFVTNAVRMDQDTAMNYLAVLRFRQQRYPEAFTLLERAYDQAIKFQAPTHTVELIVGTAREIALAIGDDAENAIWMKRAPISN
jgi:tetratricopeptide (TPR) repeat protein